MEQLIGPLQEQWLKSLEQHPERQGKGFLGRQRTGGVYTACCLAEYLLIAGKGEWRDRDLWDGDSKSYLEKSWWQLGLYGKRGERLEGSLNDTLGELNDSGKTWPEIAAIIRADPKAYLSKAV